MSIQKLFKGRIPLNLGLAILFFSMVFPPSLSLLPVKPLQSTDYPPPQNTLPPYPGTQATTPAPTSPATPTPVGFSSTSTQGVVVVTPTLQPSFPVGTSLTPAQTLTAANDIFLTENAEMGQSQASPFPTETPSPSVTLAASPTLPTPTSVVAPPNEDFAMNWGYFLVAFFGVILIGGTAWFAFLKRLFFDKI